MSEPVIVAGGVNDEFWALCLVPSDALPHEPRIDHESGASRIQPDDDRRLAAAA